MARINMNGIYSTKEICTHVNNEDALCSYTWNDGAFTWTLDELCAELDDGDECKLSLAGFSDEARDVFTETFAEAIAKLVPAYDQDADAATPSPWCAPWTWESDPYEYILTGDGPEADAKEYAEAYADQVNVSFK